MTENVLTHTTVLLSEAVDELLQATAGADGHYVDATFGRGGHSRLILSRLSKQGRLMAYDKDLEAIAEVVREHPQVWVYADEIYSKLVYQDETSSAQFVSIASLPGMQERTIISDGASKTYAMTGWRIGFTANKTLAPVFTRWITNTESCATQVSQWAALQALTGPQTEADAMRERFRARRRIGDSNAPPKPDDQTAASQDRTPAAVRSWLRRPFGPSRRFPWGSSGLDLRSRS